MSQPCVEGRAGNMAAADLRFAGGSELIFAHSGIDDPTGPQLAMGLVGNTEERAFSTMVLPNRIGKPIDRAHDSEAKIFEYVAATIGENSQIRGQINLFAELEICASCFSVRDQFIQRYPNIAVNVLDNSNIRIKAKKEGSE